MDAAPEGGVGLSWGLAPPLKETLNEFVDAAPDGGVGLSWGLAPPTYKMKEHKNCADGRSWGLAPPFWPEDKLDGGVEKRLEEAAPDWSRAFGATEFAAEAKERAGAAHTTLQAGDFDGNDAPELTGGVGTARELQELASLLM